MKTQMEREKKNEEDEKNGCTDSVLCAGCSMSGNGKPG